jgi:hypothetical protein
MQSRALRNGLSLTALTLSLTLAIPAQAALLDEHNGQLYDNVTKLVWLQNANLAATNNFGVSGIAANGYMNWSTAKSWIAAMNAANYLGHNDWMLPTVSPVAGGSNWNYNYSTNGTTDLAYNVSGQASLMGYMYYQNLGLKGANSPSGVFQPNFGIYGNGITGGQANVGLVNNLQSNVYWSGTAYAPDPANIAWTFDTYNGLQDIYYHASAMAVWGVRAGTAADIAATVPEPESYAMLLAGIGLMGVIPRRRKQS